MVQGKPLSPLPKVSVIVPVYNTAAYLRQCLDSIAGQTLRDIEILCVDDGSTDESPDILREYALNDHRFRVFEQENRYAGMARNVGIDHARGDYLVFWDSDDYFDQRALQLMYEHAKRYDADMCVCGASRYFEESNALVPNDKYLDPRRLLDAPVFNRHSNPDFILTFTTVMLWNKMYARAFVEREHLRFQGRRYAEDVYFSAAALLMAERIVTVREYLVTYRIGRADSLVSTLDKSPTDAIEAWGDVWAAFGSLDDFPEWSYFYKVVSVLRHTARQLRTREGKRAYRRALRRGALRHLGLTGRPFSVQFDRARRLLQGGN